MREVNIRTSFDSFAEDLLGERGTRPLVIVGAAKVDDLLLEILRAYLLPKIVRPAEQDELLEGDSPLATFSARIKTCRRLGLIDDTLYRALERLRILRNLSAHSVSFDHAASPVRDHLVELKARITNRASYQLTMRRYFDRDELTGIDECQCLLLTVCVLLQAVSQKVKMTTGNGAALRIAAR